MATKEQFNGADVYNIEMWDGQKIVHIFGTFWSDCGRYSLTEYTWLMIPLEDFLKMDDDDIYLAMSESKQYEEDFNTPEEWFNAFKTYHDGHQSASLPYNQLTMDTPCGAYYS